MRSCSTSACPAWTGSSAMRAFRDRIGQAPIIVITAFGNLETAVRAMEGGAFDYLVKPFDLDQATTVVKRALEKRRPRRPPRTAAPRRPRRRRSSARRPRCRTSSRASPSSHRPTSRCSSRARAGPARSWSRGPSTGTAAGEDGPFLPICLAALSPSLVERELFGHLRGSFTGAVQDRKGLLELADGGTVLLDEVGDIPPDLQVKLLRVIEHREVTPVGDARPRPTDIRVIAATNRPLAELMATGQFREDLFFRLERLPDPHPAAPRPAGGHPGPGRALPAAVPPAGRRRRPLPRRSSTSSAAALAGERPRASQRHRARGHRRPRPDDPPGALPAGPDGPGATATRGRPTRSGGSSPSGHGRRPGAASQPSGRAAALRAIPGADRAARSSGPPWSVPHNRAAAAQVLGIHRATLRQKLNKYGIS